MKAIVSRRRKDGTLGHTAQIRLKKGGKVIHTESKTFDRKLAVQAWLKKRETELAEPGALTKPTDPLLKEMIDQYNLEKQQEHGKTKTKTKTKAQVLNTIKGAKIGELHCSEINSQELVAFCKTIHAQPSTRGNYMSHLASIFSVARPLWGYPRDKQAINDARVMLDAMGLIGRSNQRTRRPTLDELDKLTKHYTLAETKRKDVIPMTRLIPSAIFSTRRQEEICRLEGKDLNKVNL